MPLDLPWLRVSTETTSSLGKGLMPPHPILFNLFLECLGLCALNIHGDECIPLINDPHRSNLPPISVQDINCLSLVMSLELSYISLILLWFIIKLLILINAIGNPAVVHAFLS